MKCIRVCDVMSQNNELNSKYVANDIHFHKP